MFFHIWRFLHFSDNRNKPDKADENYESLWKIRSVFDKLGDPYAKYYSSSEHSAIDKITVLFKGWAIFKLYTLKKRKFGIKIYNLCDSKGHAHNMWAYLGKDRKCMTGTVTTIHATVTRIL